MAGWSIFGNAWGNPASDPTHVDIYNEFVDAIKERQDCLDDFTPTYTVAKVNGGDDLHATLPWGKLQQALEELVPHFVDKGEANGGNFDNYAADVIPLYTLANWRADIGLQGAGFRRVPGSDWPTDWTDFADAAYSAHGLASVPDIIGPWICDDIQRGLNLLVWTKRHSLTDANLCCWHSDGINNVEYCFGEDGASWNNACDEKDTYWGTHTLPWSQESSLDFVAPQSTYAGCHIFMPFETWDAMVYHRSALIRLQSVPKTLNGSDRKRDVDFYIFSNCDPGETGFVWTFDAQGDDVIQDRQSLFDTKLAQTGTTIKSLFHNDQDIQPPNRCVDPKGLGGSGGGEYQTMKGYYGSGSWNPWKGGAGGAGGGGTAVIRWDVTDGFEYY